MRVDNEFIKRRWNNFRQGHGIYLIFAMTFLNFITIQYVLLIEEVPELKTVFPNAWIFAVVFVVIYVPLAIVLGHLHYKKQLPNEQRQLHDNNPLAFYGAPGKELDLTLPAAIIGYEKQLKGMKIHNELADAWRLKFGILIEKWSDKDFQEVELMLEYHKRLKSGESITEIVKHKADNPQIGT